MPRKPDPISPISLVSDAATNALSAGETVEDILSAVVAAAQRQFRVRFRFVRPAKIVVGGNEYTWPAE
jgi:hypothetical protein